MLGPSPVRFFFKSDQNVILQFLLINLGISERAELCLYTTVYSRHQFRLSESETESVWEGH